MKYRNLLSLIFVCVLAAGLLAGCGKKDVTETPDDPGQTVTDPVTQPEENEVKVEITEDEPDTPAPVDPAPDEEPDIDPAFYPMDEAELKSWEAWLNARTVNELFNQPFESPDEVSLHEMFYNGVDEGNGYPSDEEIAALKAVIGEIYTDVTKVTTEDIISTFYHHFGVELTRKEIEARMENEWIYLKEYDAWYDHHGDTNMRTIRCISGELHPADATIVLTCVDKNSDETFTVGLSENKDGCTIDYIRPVSDAN